MKDDYTNNSHYLTYAFLFERLGECPFWTWEWKGWFKRSLHSVSNFSVVLAELYCHDDEHLPTEVTWNTHFRVARGERDEFYSQPLRSATNLTLFATIVNCARFWMGRTSISEMHSSWPNRSHSTSCKLVYGSTLVFLFFLSATSSFLCTGTYGATFRAILHASSEDAPCTHLRLRGIGAIQPMIY